MSEIPKRDLAPALHLAVGSLLILAFGAARMFGWFDFGGGTLTALMLFPALVSLAGQPRGQRAWLMAGFAAFLLVAVVGFGIPRLDALTSHNTGSELVTFLATVLGAGVAIGIVRERSGPVPEHSAANPRAWKPATQRGVLLGLIVGAAVFAASSVYWRGWAKSSPEIEAVAGLVVYLQAFAVGVLAAITTIYCRPWDFRSTVLSLFAGLGSAVLLATCTLGTMTLIRAFMPGREILQAMHDSLVISAALTIPMISLVAWILGQRPENFGVDGAFIAND